jgi:predicted aspartyl protease
LFKIAKLNLRGKTKEWFRKLQPVLADWTELRNLIVQKYGNIDVDDIRMKLDAIKQEPKERVQKYFERLDKLFQKGRIQDTEQRRRFLARLWPEIRKLCVVRTFANIEELVGAATELERVLGELGETPFEPLKKEQEEGIEGTIMEKQVIALNDMLINFFKGTIHNPEASSPSAVFGRCQICKGGDHLVTTCPRLNEAQPKCAKCGMPHRTENCGVKCTFCTGLGHSEDRCWKKPKEGKSHSRTTNFLEVLLNDEAATLQQFNKLCGNENLFFYTRVPRRRILVDVASGGVEPTPQIVGDGVGADRDAAVRSKILAHFIKGKISLTPMETILMIPGELEHLKSLVKLARRRKDSEAMENQVSMESAVPALKKICINKTHRSKILHFLVEINNYVVEGLVDTGASMSIMAATIVRELGMMHLVTGSETYKTASGVVTQALGRIDEVPMKVGGVQCIMTFMVVDTDSYDVLLGLDLLIKIGVIVDVERGLIQVRHGPGANVEVLPLTMVNLLHRMNSEALVDEATTILKNTHINDNSAWMPDHDSTIMPGVDDASTSESETSIDGSEHCEWDSHQLKQIDCEDEFKDTELEDLVESEGSQEILQLILQE